MTKSISISELPLFDPTPYLDSEEAIVAYLADIRRANDPGLLASALNDVERARRCGGHNRPTGGKG
ncbi:hypothetical protein ACTOWA_18580 [Herbaspirillum seropedicae]|uniref:hypothetical protein n=1 Tax=Herbaspirillum seropedicae TaxID=964 RepID=UPI000863B270|nr:hypothetical protein [Herbaspirillum seropedicae]AON53341.1 hypothetical protein Hsc_1037 [Herbaspirillum seropedicae]